VHAGTNVTPPPGMPTEGEPAVVGFFNAVPHAVVIASTDGVIQSVNAAAEALLGYMGPELIGKSVETLVPADVREGHALARSQFGPGAHSPMQGTSRTLRAVRKDGSQFAAVIGISHWASADGPRLIACILDDEARQRAEHAAEAEHRAAVEAGELSQAVIFSAPFGIILYDAVSGECVSANAAASTITGVAHEALRAQRFREIASWHGSGMLDAAEESLATNRHVTRDVELVTSASKSVSLTCEFLSITLRERPLLVLMMNDRTERRTLEAQLRVAQKMEAVGQLAGGVAHDFNNLLTVIGTYSSLMLEETPEGDPRREDLEEIFSAAQRAATLTRQLLAFGRRQLLDARRINMNEVVSDLEKMLRRVLSAQIALDVRLEPNLGLVHADPGQVEQAVLNLVVNARDAMPSGGRLVIETLNVVNPPDSEQAGGRPTIGRRREPRHRVSVRVTDTGFGMDEATMSRIFEPFYTTKEAGKGSGLGLSTTYGIVRQSGGTISVVSAPQQGTTFTLSFPRVEGEPAELGASRSAAGDAHGTGSILVVEDDAHVRRIVVDTLVKRGYDVTQAQNGREALEMALALPDPPDLVVTDVVMPELGGRELAERLRERWPELRVLFTTAYATDPTLPQVAAEEQRVGLLRKPFVPEELGAAVRRALSES